MSQMQGTIPPLTPIPPSSTFIRSTTTFAPLPKRPTQKPTSLSFSHSSASSSVTSLAYNPPSTNPSDHELERQRHLRQNQEIIRLCALKSTQIRQSESKLSQLESENLELRTALRKVEQQLCTKSVVQPIKLSAPLPCLGASETSLEGLRLSLQSRDKPNETSLSQRFQKQSEGEGSWSNKENESDHVQHERDLENFSEEDEAHRVKMQLEQVVSGTISTSKRSLISKLNQIQVIYQREHETLCTMMGNFNSTTRLYKDVICLLEREAAEPSEKSESHNHGEFSSSDSVPFPRPRYINGNSWFDTKNITPPSSLDATGERWTGCPGRSNFFSSSTISPERNQTLKSPQRRTVAQVPLSPESSHDFSKVRMGSSTNEQDNQTRQTATSIQRQPPSINTGESTSLEMNPDRRDIAPKSRPCLTRPISHGLPKINILPSIDEQDNIDTQSLSPPWQQGPPNSSYPYSRQPDSDLQRPRSEDQQAQGAAVRDLKRSLAIRAPISLRRGILNPYKCRNDVSSPHANALTPKSRHSKDERVSVINLPNFSIMERTNEASAASFNSDPFTSSAAGSAADNCTDDVFIRSTETGGNSTHADDSDESDGSRKHNQSHIAAGSNGDRSRNKGATKGNTNDITTKDNTITGSGNTSNTNEYSIFTNSLRVTAPSPMIKSRSAIASERVKYMTPKWVSRRTSKIPQRNPLLPDLPSTRADNTTKFVHKRQASLASASSLGFPSTSRYDLSLPVSDECQSSSFDPEADQSSIPMPPPPPRPRPRSVRPPKIPKQDQHRRKHRKRHNMATLIPTSRLRSQFVVGERRNVTSTPDFNESRHSGDNINSIDSGHNDRETRNEVALGIGESSVRSKSRPGKGAIVYRLPSISKKLFQGDPGTYSLTTPLRPLTVPGTSFTFKHSKSQKPVIPSRSLTDRHSSP